MSALILTPSQRRHLKQLAHNLKPLLQMGKEGPSSAFMAQLLEQIAAHELIKIRVLNNCEATVDEIERPITEADMTIVQKVGHVYTVYKQREEKSRVNLPKR